LTSRRRCRFEVSIHAAGVSRRVVARRGNQAGWIADHVSGLGLAQSLKFARAIAAILQHGDLKIGDSSKPSRLQAQLEQELPRQRQRSTQPPKPTGSRIRSQEVACAKNALRYQSNSLPASRRRGLSGCAARHLDHLRTVAQSVEIVCPCRHHRPALIHEFGAVVGHAQRA